MPLAITRLYKTLLEVAKSRGADTDPIGVNVNPMDVVGCQGTVPPEGWQAVVSTNLPRKPRSLSAMLVA